MSTDRVTVMLAGPTQDLVTYQFSPPFMADPGRFLIVNTTTKGGDLKENLLQYKPQVLVIRSDLMPDMGELIDALSKLSMWQGVALVIVPAAHRDIRGSFERVDVVRGIFVEPLNWGEIVQKTYAEAMTERAKHASAAPLQQAYVRSGGAVAGTRVVAFLGADGGAGASTIAEGAAWQLRGLNVRTLLCSFDQPPAVVPHLRFTYLPHAIEHHYRPADGFGSALQSKEGLDVIVAPEMSREYALMAEKGPDEDGSIYSLVMASWTRGYAAVLLDLPHGEGAWTLQSVAAANTAVIVARPTLSDMAGVKHLLSLLLGTLSAKLRISRESIYLVLNQIVPEKSSFTPAQFFNELAQVTDWVPQVIASIPYQPVITQQQDRQVSPVGTVDEFTAGIRRIGDVLFPGLDTQAAGKGGGKGGLKIGPIRFK